MGTENINPWAHIWTAPRKTMRAILTKDPRRLILWLAIIGGIFSTFTSIGYMWLQQPDSQVSYFIPRVIGMLLGGAIFGIIHLYFGGWLYQLTGSWVGGQGSYTEVKSAVGWANYPFIVASFIGLIGVIVTPFTWLVLAFGLVNLALIIWGFVIWLHLLGEAHRFSAWKSLLAVIIALLLIFVAVMLVSLLVPLLAPLFY